MGATHEETNGGVKGSAGWGEIDSARFIELGRVITPERDELADALLALIPTRPDEAFACVDVACGQGWLSAAILERFPRASVLALDGSPAMLAEAARTLAPFGARAEMRRFRLEEPDWRGSLPTDLRCVCSSLAVHHLDGAGKRALYADCYRALAPGGALLIADLVAPASELARRYAAGAWDAAVERQSREQTGDTAVAAWFARERWNIFAHPDPMDRPSAIAEHLGWLAEVGFVGIDIPWVRAGHAVYGGYKPMG